MTRKAIGCSTGEPVTQWARALDADEVREKRVAEKHASAPNTAYLSEPARVERVAARAASGRRSPPSIRRSIGR